MNGWMNCCKEHLNWLKNDIKKNGYVFQFASSDADKRCRCDVEGCKNRAYHEVFWGEESIEDMLKEDCFVPLEGVK